MVNTFASLLMLLILCICSSTCTNTTEKSIAKKKIPTMQSPNMIIGNTTKQTATLIFLHGLGEMGVSVLRPLHRFHRPYMKIIVPNADLLEVPIHEHRIYTWYDYTNTTNGTKGMKNAKSYIHYLIDTQIKNGIPPERIILGGFDQGAELAIDSAKEYPKKIAGVLSFSKSEPVEKHSVQDLHQPNKDIPILSFKGEQDKEKASKAEDEMKFENYFGVIHAITKEETDQVNEFFNKHIP